MSPTETSASARTAITPGAAVILANGLFPKSELALDYLRAADRLICCDGAAEHLWHHRLVPDVIVGDLDSLSDHLRTAWHDRLVRIEEQETNDLTKAVCWAADQGIERAVILGADGHRIDHAIGNAGLLVEHCHRLDLMMLTDDGILFASDRSTEFASVRGQQVSIFTFPSSLRITTRGLKYPLDDQRLVSWWSGTLNECLGDSFGVAFSNGRILVYLNHRDS